MTTSRVLARVFAIGLGALAWIGDRAAALDYPTRPVRFIVCFAAGGPNDITARLFGQYLADNLGQQFIIENRVGAGGNIAIGLAAKAAPDGYTLLAVSSAYVVNPSLYANAPYDPFKDFQPITLAVDAPNILSVNPSFPAKTVAELVAHVKANPGKYSIATAGIGTTPHLAGELFKMLTGTNMLHVPYRGDAPAVTDLLGGQVQVLFDQIILAIEHIRAGRLRALAVTSKTRIAILPDLPTVADFVPGYEAFAWQGIGAPKDTPPDIIAKLNSEIIAGLADPKIKERIANLGGIPMPMTPPEFGKLIANETEKWGKVIKFANIKPQ
jgi:tripartite-type tricarboxylate transporter receptor subunit TctC